MGPPRLELAGDDADRARRQTGNRLHRRKAAAYRCESRLTEPQHHSAAQNFPRYYVVVYSGNNRLRVREREDGRQVTTLTVCSGDSR